MCPKLVISVLMQKNQKTSHPKIIRLEFVIKMCNGCHPPGREGSRTETETKRREEAKRPIPIGTVSRHTHACTIKVVCTGTYISFRILCVFCSEFFLVVSENFGVKVAYLD